MNDHDRSANLDGFDKDSLPSDESNLDSTLDGPVANQRQPDAPRGFAASDPPRPDPESIGGYRVKRPLGNGGFGAVYHVVNDQLDPPLDFAIKVPLSNCLEPHTREKLLKALRNEAATLCRLTADPQCDPHIVRVINVGEDPQLDVPFFLVMQYIEGQNLAQYVKDNRLDPRPAAALIATIARALAYAHSKRVVHLDIKPANILIDAKNVPYLVDFGLARRELDLRRAARVGGSWPYMSPEQARGESLDHRSDIYSLGVVLFELLTDQRPFGTPDDDWERIRSETEEAPPLGGFDRSLPDDLELICQKALRKQPSQRYGQAAELAQHLEDFVAGKPLTNFRCPAAGASPAVTGQPPEILPTRRDTSLVTAHCRGLRAFEAKDASFFLDLLPGVRDPATRLPESILSWKIWCEETDPEKTSNEDTPYRVGVISGPSGCGKSSLVNAGLLPQLDKEKLLAVRIDADRAETENKLLKHLRIKFETLPSDLDLRDTLWLLAQGDMMPQGSKLLIILDQFERWLQAHPEPWGTELVGALRHCDGRHLQCLVLVRADFPLGITRFMQALDVKLVDKLNSIVVDLFHVAHAKIVLTAFGRGYGRFGDSGQPTTTQRQFLERAVQELAEKPTAADREAGDRVTCVELALFAFMLEKKPWEPDTLRDGGAMRVGVSFLKSIFDNPSSAPSQNRVWVRDAEAVLESLLPPPGIDHRDKICSAEELRAVVKQTDFAELIRILDPETRLITSVEAPEGAAHVAASLRDAIPLSEKPAHVAASLRDATPVSEKPGHVAASLRDATPVSEKPGHVAASLRDATPVSEKPDHVAASLRDATPVSENPGHVAASLRDANPVSEKPGYVGLKETGQHDAPSPHGYYQLTHDYLVRAIRQWLYEKQLTSRRGRARLRLIHRAGLWNANPQKREDRQLPAVWEYLNIRLLLWAERKRWTRPQTEMMQRARRLYGIRATLFSAVLLVAVVLGFYAYEAISVNLQILAEPDPANVPALVAQTDVNRFLLNGLLRFELSRLDGRGVGFHEPSETPATSSADSSAEDEDERQEDPDESSGAGTPPAENKENVFKRLNVTMALLPANARLLADLVPNTVEYQGTRLLDLEPKQMGRLFPLLASQREALVARLGQVVALEVSPPWEDPPLDPAWSEPDPAVVAQIARAGGMVRDRFAFCVSLPVEDIEFVGQALAAAGYSFVSIQPTAVLGDTATATILWNRDGRDYLQALQTAVSSSTDDRVSPDDPAVQTRYLVQLPPDQHLQLSEQLVAKGYRPNRLAVQTEGDSVTVDSRWQRPNVEESDERLAKRQAAAAALLARLGETEVVWPLFRFPLATGDPRRRSYLIDRIAPVCCDPAVIIERLQRSQAETSELRGLLLTLGNLAKAKKLTQTQRTAMQTLVFEWFKAHRDAGVHGAAYWTLRQLGVGDPVSELTQQERDNLPDLKGDPHRQWYITPGGRTMTVIRGPTRFWMGSDAEDGEADADERPRHQRRIDRTYAICAFEETVAAFRLFWEDWHKGEDLEYDSKVSEHDFCPINSVTWYQAAEFCNWLSLQEGLVPCYLNCEGNDGPGTYAEGMSLKPDFVKLSGYRLPTNGEWEHACRAGSQTSRFFGGTGELAPRYARFSATRGEKTSATMVGTFLPNDFGLFDVYGNMYEWCLPLAYLYGDLLDLHGESVFNDPNRQELTEPKVSGEIDTLQATNGYARILRSCSFADGVRSVRSGYRGVNRPSYRTRLSGFRVARTLTP